MYFDVVVLKRRWGGEVVNVWVLVAIGVGVDGYRRIRGIAEGQKEDLEDGRSSLRYLKSGVSLACS